MGKRLTTRGVATAEAIRDGKAFDTHGALRATRHDQRVAGRRVWLPGDTWLPTKYHADVADAVYVVWSYETPIAWVHEDGRTVVPNVKYTVTTSMHQGMLYLLQRTAVGCAA